MKLLVVLALTAIFTTGCVSVESDDIRREPTTGQELIDLAKAHENGLLSDEEYQRERRKVLRDN